MTKNILIYSLISFCSLFVVAAANAAQPFNCTPVIYAFRHAEDVNDPPHLTALGEQHADLYPEMVTDFGTLHNYCPVGFVYATYDINPDGGGGTPNPFQTGEPLADVGCYNLAIAIASAEGATGFGFPIDMEACGAEHAVPPINGGSFPHMALRGGGNLYEFVGASKAEKNTGKSATADNLRAELLANISYIRQFDQFSPKGMSSAVFWTSQGLNILGQAITPGFVDIPGCSKVPLTSDCKEKKAPRNAVYVFVYNGTGFDPPENVTQYLQCFNVKSGGQPGGTQYYCKPGNLPAGIVNLPSLRGKICDTTNPAADCVMLP